jgi:hypothetical protein
MAWTLTTPHNTARTTAAQAAANAKTLQLADAGAGPSTLQIYDKQDPATRKKLATITLADPCGVLVGGQIQLTQADPMGDLVQITGVPTWAEWLDGGGQMLATCTVSAEGGDGDLKISSRADGQIFAGGFITLEEGLIG